MRHVNVDFNNQAGSGELLAPAHGYPLTPGERVTVSDDGTDTYEAVVLGISRDTVFLKVSDAPRVDSLCDQ